MRRAVLCTVLLFGLVMVSHARLCPSCIAPFFGSVSKEILQQFPNQPSFGDTACTGQYTDPLAADNLQRALAARWANLIALTDFPKYQEGDRNHTRVWLHGASVGLAAPVVDGYIRNGQQGDRCIMYEGRDSDASSTKADFESTFSALALNADSMNVDQLLVVGRAISGAVVTVDQGIHCKLSVPASGLAVWVAFSRTRPSIATTVYYSNVCRLPLKWSDNVQYCLNAAWFDTATGEFIEQAPGGCIDPLPAQQQDFDDR